MRIYRQGDVLVRRIERVPEGLTPVDRQDGRLILAEGEVTGHHHAIAAGDVELLQGEDLGEHFLRVLDEAGVGLSHEEHATITLPPGDYRVSIQREYSPEAIRRVMD